MSTSRLGKCEVCDKNDAKYTCPECEVKTCSLPCVVIHKKELDCNGIRSRVKFKAVKSFTNMDLQNDYRLLEEVGRSAEKYSKDRRVHGHFELPKHLYRLRAAASRRNVNLHFLPRDFQKNKRNTTYLDFRTQELFWRIEWTFPQAEDVKYVNERVIDSELLGNVLENYINPSKNDEKKLKYYHAAGHPGIIILLKAEKIPGNRFYELDVRSSVRENLADKIIIEFPVLHVILKDHKQFYDVITPDEEEEIIRKQQLERSERDQKGSFKRKFDHRGYGNFNKNLLFPIEDQFDDLMSSENGVTSASSFKGTSVEECDINVNGTSPASKSSRNYINCNSKKNHDFFIPNYNEL